jgi:streptogramin lyase
MRLRTAVLIGTLALVCVGATAATRLTKLDNAVAPTDRNASVGKHRWSIFPVSGANTNFMTADHDGRIWFTKLENKIGVIDAAGAITEYAVPPPAGGLQGITYGKDGSVWFAAGDIVRFSPKGIFTEYMSHTAFPAFVALGIGGDIWFTGQTNGGNIGRITSHGRLTLYPRPGTQTAPTGITEGPDGNMWFTTVGQAGVGTVGKITPAGTITEYSLPSGGNPTGITRGFDGNLWFVEGSRVGKVTVSGQIIEYPIPPPVVASGQRQIVEGSDGALWTEGTEPNNFGVLIRVTTTGSVTIYREPSQFPCCPLGGIAAGPHGDIWFTSSSGIGRFRN